MSRVPNPSCTTAGHENVPAAGIVRVDGRPGFEHPYCDKCIDTFESVGDSEVIQRWSDNHSSASTWPPHVSIGKCMLLVFASAYLSAILAVSAWSREDNPALSVIGSASTAIGLVLLAVWPATVWPATLWKRPR